MLFVCFLFAFYTHSIYISYTFKVKMKVKKWRPKINEDGQKTLFPKNVWGPLGCHLLSSLVPKSRFRGSEKNSFPNKVLRFKMMQNYPLSIFHASVWPESLPGADLSTFQKVRFPILLTLFRPFRAQFSNFLIGRVVAIGTRLD